MHENIQSVSAWREKETASPAALTLKIESWIILYIRPSTPHFAPSPSPSPPHPERGHEADSQEPRVLANITPANHITITTSSKSSSSIIGHPRPGATCNLSERRRSHFHCWDVQCARARMWLSGWLVTWCAALYSTLYTVHCTVQLTPCHTASLACSTNPSLTNMHPRWNLARSNMYGNSDI